MKKSIGYILSWTLYWLGNLVSKPMHYIDWWWLYPVYNNLMRASLSVQDWAKIDGPWSNKNG